MQDHASSRWAGLSMAALMVLSGPPLTSAAEPAQPPTDSATASTWRLGNGYLELQFQRRGSQVSVARLTNKLSGRTLPFTQDNFSLGVAGRPPLRAADFVFAAIREEPIAGGRRLVCQLKHTESGARLDVIYELGDRDCFIRRRLELVPTGPLPLREVDMWCVGLEGTCSAQEQGVPLYLQLGPEWKYTAKHHGFGYPVFLEDTFWGLEYPAGYNHFERGLLTLRHYPGRTISERFVSKTAVLGVAEPGQVPRRFQQYLSSLVGLRTSPRLFLAWKTWVTVNSPNEANCLALIDSFRRDLFDVSGARLDSFALDDGWDQKASLWDIERGVFPRGFEPLRTALKPLRTGLGLWISPSSGYDHGPWLAATRGYKKNAWDWLLCQSDPNYRRDMVKAVTELVTTNEVNYVKFDAFCAPCDAQGHDHHLPDNFAKEANTDAYLELQAALRRAQPGVFINITTGTWLSPWWLQHVDAVWDQVFDGWSPGIAPTPERSYSQITDRDSVFRKRCRENPWFPIEAVENLGVWTHDYRFIDEQLMTILGRGCRLISFYVPIPNGPNARRDWQFFGTAINWARHNEETLLRTRMILGDPLKLEPYGYAHFLGQRGVLVLRNPFLTPRTVHIPLDESVGWSQAEAEKHGRRPLVAKVVYPHHQTLPAVAHYGAELTLELSAYEMLVVHLTPLENSEPALLGARQQELERSGNRVSYAVYGQPGERRLVSVVGAQSPDAVLWNGGKLVPTKTLQGSDLSLAMDGTPPTCRIERGQLSARATDNGWTIAGTCVATVPEGTPATMHLMWAAPEALHPPAATFADAPFHLIDDAAEKALLRRQAQKLNAAKPRCAVNVNGQPVGVAVNDSKLYRPENVGDHRAYAEYPPAAWVWFKFGIPAGRSEVVVTIECPQGDLAEMKAEVGWWLWAESPLSKGTLTLTYAGPLPARSADPLPLAVRQEQQRQIFTVQPVTAYCLPATKMPPSGPRSGLAGAPKNLAQHLILGTWTYQHDGRNYTREFTKDGFCVLKDGVQFGWKKAFRVVDECSVLVEDQLLHVLIDKDTLNVEDVFTAKRVPQVKPVP